MVDYVQLELFDLRPYISKQFPAYRYEVKQVEELQPSLEYKQLELDLFPQQAGELLSEFLAIAA